jgi:molybdate transport system substrate-binding protein
VSLLRVATIAFMLTGALRAVGSADAAEIKVLSSGALKLALSQLLPSFETSSGNSVKVEYGPAGAIAKRIAAGDAADVAIATISQIEDLEKAGKIVPGSKVSIAGIALGVAVRQGAPKPDIGTVQAFKRALLAAQSIGYRDPATGSTSGTYTAKMIEQLGIAADLKPKTKLDNSPGDRPENVFGMLARGEVEMQIGQITEIVMAPGVELVGPLPGETQNVSMLTAGVVTGCMVPDAAKAFISYVTSPAAAKVLTDGGFQSPN